MGQDLLNINNKECLLVEFILEDKIQTGFKCWLDENFQKNLENIIKNGTIVEISWPNVDISSAVTLKKSLKKAVFKKYQVKILFCGEWVEVRTMQAEMEKYGDEDTSKINRKNLKKKTFDTDHSEDDSNEVNDSTSKINRKMLLKSVKKENSDRIIQKYKQNNLINTREQLTLLENIGNKPMNTINKAVENQYHKIQNFHDEIDSTTEFHKEKYSNSISLNEEIPPLGKDKQTFEKISEHTAHSTAGVSATKIIEQEPIILSSTSQTTLQTLSKKSCNFSKQKLNISSTQASLSEKDEKKIEDLAHDSFIDSNRNDSIHMTAAQKEQGIPIFSSTETLKNKCLEFQEDVPSTSNKKRRWNFPSKKAARMFFKKGSSDKTVSPSTNVSRFKRRRSHVSSSSSSSSRYSSRSPLKYRRFQSRSRKNSDFSSSRNRSRSSSRQIYGILPKCHRSQFQSQQNRHSNSSRNQSEFNKTVPSPPLKDNCSQFRPQQIADSNSTPNPSEFNLRQGTRSPSTFRRSRSRSPPNYGSDSTRMRSRSTSRRHSRSPSTSRRSRSRSQPNYDSDPTRNRSRSSSRHVSRSRLTFQHSRSRPQLNPYSNSTCNQSKSDKRFSSPSIKDNRSNSSLTHNQSKSDKRVSSPPLKDNHFQFPPKQTTNSDSSQNPSGSTFRHDSNYGSDTTQRRSQSTSQRHYRSPSTSHRSRSRSQPNYDSDSTRSRSRFSSRRSSRSPSTTSLSQSPPNSDSDSTRSRSRSRSRQNSHSNSRRFKRVRIRNYEENNKLLMIKNYKPRLYKQYKRLGMHEPPVYHDRYERYEKVHDKIYLGLGIKVGKTSWELMNKKGKDIFLREVAMVLWKKDLGKICLDLSKINKFQNMNNIPIRPASPQKLELYLGLYEDYLNDNHNYRKLDDDKKDILIKNSTENLSYLIRDKRKQLK